MSPQRANAGGRHAKLRALQTLTRGSVAPSNIEARTDMDCGVMMREAFGVREACFRFAMKPVKLSDELYVRRGSSPAKRCSQSAIPAVRHGSSKNGFVSDSS